MRLEHWRYTLPLRLRAVFRRGTAERELDDELHDHLDRLTAQFESRGLETGRARTEALRAMGGLERRKEEMRDARRVALIENLWRDVRHAWRQLRNARAYAAVSVITLAVGIGANAAVFTVIKAVLLRPLDYGAPGDLFVLQYADQETITPGGFLRWHAALPAFAAIGAAQSQSPTLTARGLPEELRGLRLTPDVLPMLQVQPLLGRYFTAEEAHRGRENVVVVSYGFWLRRLGGDSAAVGQTLVLDGAPCTVIGVMPRTFQFAPFWRTHADIFSPLVLDGQENDFDGASLRIFARLGPGASMTQARAELRATAAAIHRDHADLPQGGDAVVVALRDKVVGSIAGTLWMLLGAVALVLLIACANVTHLRLLHAASRTRETAMRLSLGASRGRVLQQSLIESLLLSLLGAVVGVVLAVAGVSLLLRLAPPGLPRIDTVHVDAGVFGYLLLVATLAGGISGAMPAVVAMRVDPNRILADGSRGSSDGRRHRRTGAWLVVSEFAMAIVLLIGAGLVLRSVAAMLGVDTGFDPHHVLSMQVAVRGTQHDAPALRGAFYTGLLDRVAELPGVESTGAINHLPLHGDNWRFSYLVEDHPATRPEDQSHAYFRVISPGYFATMRIPLVRGRDISGVDLTDRRRVVILDQTAAAADWPGVDPIGKRISVTAVGQPPDWFTVIGVASDVQQPNWAVAHGGEMYYPYWYADPADSTGGFIGELSPTSMTLVVRARGSLDQLRAPVTAAVERLDADAPVADVITMDAAVGEQIAEPRFYLMLLVAFAGSAVLLAAVGVYGVIGYTVATRQHEIGIRLALGAATNEPIRLIVRQGVLLAAGGAAAGIGAALLLTRYLQSLLFRIQPVDPVTFVAVPVFLIAVAALACWLPARRAARVDPATVLRAN